jgi:hypothetical protein
MRLPAGYRPAVVRLREPDLVDVEAQALDRRAAAVEGAVGCGADQRGLPAGSPASRG